MRRAVLENRYYIDFTEIITFARPGIHTSFCTTAAHPTTNLPAILIGNSKPETLPINLRRSSDVYRRILKLKN
jgi:hypothetical protein